MHLSCVGANAYMLCSVVCERHCLGAHPHRCSDVLAHVLLVWLQVSLPMLAPLLLGSGMLFRSIKSNASFLFPRISLVVVLMWVLWFGNSVVQNTVTYLQRQGRLDHRISAAVITGSELFTMLGAGVIVLSALGVNVSGLLLPAGVCLAIASKDLAHNFLAGTATCCTACKSAVTPAAEDHA